MKKIATLLFGLALSPSIFAGTIAANADATARTIAASDDGCALLAEGVVINLSRDVPAGYACNTGTNVISFAACHPNGRKTPAGLNFIYAGSSAGGQISAIGTDGAASTTQSAVCSAANLGTASETVAGIEPVVVAPGEEPDETP